MPCPGHTPPSAEHLVVLKVDLRDEGQGQGQESHGAHICHRKSSTREEAWRKLGRNWSKVLQGEGNSPCFLLTREQKPAHSQTQNFPTVGPAKVKTKALLRTAYVKPTWAQHHLKINSQWNPSSSDLFICKKWEQKEIAWPFPTQATPPRYL